MHETTPSLTHTYWDLNRQSSLKTKKESHSSESAVSISLSSTNDYTSIKQIFINWSESVDINCYNKLIEYRAINFYAQLTWFLILLCSTAATFWLISNSIIDYLNFDVVTQTNFIYEIPTQFPTITFCENDAFTTRDAQRLYEEMAVTINYTQVNVVNDDLNHLVQMAAANPSFGDENRKRLGFLNKTIIYTCKYNKVKCANELRWYYSFEFGNCWQFNVGYNGTNHKIEVCLLLVYSSFFITSPFITALARLYGQYFCTLCQNLIFLIFSN